MSSDPYRHRPLLLRAVNFAAAHLPGRSRWIEPRRLKHQARQRTGLNVFGGRRFESRLELLTESLNNEAHLNFVGRVAAQTHLAQLLENRLLLVRDRALHAGIAGQEIVAPIFITGLPRSGSTLLHGLLAADPHNRTPATWEVMAPSPPPQFADPERIGAVERSLRWVDRLAPAFRGVHPLGATLPQECIAITTIDFASVQFHTTYNVPSYQRWFDERGAALAYEWHKKFLQHLQYGRSAARWVLKAPAHMTGLPALFAAYPDARIVQTHRDPVTVCASIANHGAVLRGAFSEHIDPAAIANYWSRYWGDALDSALAYRTAHADAPFFDLRYDDLVANPVAAVCSLYEQLGLTMTPRFAKAMRHYLANDPATRVPRHRYNPAQFGLDPRALAERFAEYCDRFGLLCGNS